MILDIIGDYFWSVFGLGVIFGLPAYHRQKKINKKYKIAKRQFKQWQYDNSTKIIHTSALNNADMPFEYTIYRELQSIEHYFSDKKIVFNRREAIEEWVGCVNRILHHAAAEKLSSGGYNFPSEEITTRKLRKSLETIDFLRPL